MSAPQKPWESTRINNYQLNRSGVTGPGRNVLHSHAPHPSGHVLTTNAGTPTTRYNAPVSQNVSSLPPLPQRPQQLFNRTSFGVSPPGFGGYSGYNSGYGSYGGYGASYGGYGMSSYGGYGGMYGVGGYGYGSFPGGFENRFLQVAEESSRDAFQSIESIVRAFTSVSMMLESTYYAMYSSFRAILGVVDNFSRLRQIFVQFLSTITVLRIIRNFYRQLLHWLGVLDYNPQSERIWESVNGLPRQDGAQVASFPRWPLLTFLAFLFGGPYLISKFFTPTNPNGNQWDPARGRNIRAGFPHQAGTESELSFQANEVLNIAPQELQTIDSSGWLLAANQSGRVGYVPITRLFTATATQAAPATVPSTRLATPAFVTPTAAVPTGDVPTAAVPTTAVPTVPTAAVSTAAVPTAAVPTAAVPTATVPTDAVPTTAAPTATLTTENVHTTLAEVHEENGSNTSEPNNKSP